MPERRTIGWDVGGAHLKACLLVGGRVADVAQWATPLWQGESHLEQALLQARDRWRPEASTLHGLTMSGEMADVYADREDGVRRIAMLARRLLPGDIAVFAGPDRWESAEAAGTRWRDIASANWLATAHHLARHERDGLLVDIGSTTTDLIPYADGRVVTTSRSDRDRLARGELVYHGVVRTPLCVLGPRLPLQGQLLNVMNELFATSADVYRLTGELDADHDLYPAADGASKSREATIARLARLVGCDRRDAGDDDWLAFARACRRQQVGLIAASLREVLDTLPAPPASGLRVASAGCGDFLVPDVLRACDLTQPRIGAYGRWVVEQAAGVVRTVDDVTRGWLARQSQLCAPSVAVACLRDGGT